MNKNLSRLAIILLVTAVVAIPALLPFAAPYLVDVPGLQKVATDAQRWYKLGTDLKGGTILIYRIKDPTKVPIEVVTTTLKGRLDTAGLKSYVVRPLGEDRVEIVMPDADLAEVEQVKYRVSRLGQLHFRIVADKDRHESLFEEADARWPAKILSQGEFVPYGVWEPVEAPPAKAPENPAAQAAAAHAREIWERAKTVTSPKVDETVWFRPLDSLNVPEGKIDNLLIRVIDGRKMVLARWQPDDRNLGFTDRNMTRIDDDGERYVLVFRDPYNIQGKHLESVRPDNKNLQVVLSFKFKPEGGRLFRNLTSEYKPEGDRKYQLGVILDGRLRSSPNINQEIGDAGIIEGNFKYEEVKDLENIFKAGQLDTELEKQPIQERTIGPSLGAETIRMSANAMIGAVVLVVLFMLAYYRVAGVVAIVALTLNVLMTVGIMVAFQQTWTLPGIAALVLTVGVSVDANILIFERIREELDAKRPFGIAVRTGYEKAWSTILDSNATSILTGVILFVVGSDQVIGFAVTLIIGLLCNMFTAVFVTRTIFDLLYEARWIRSLSMARMLSNPNYAFLAWARPAIVASLVVITAGALAVASRGRRMLEIDFTGGTAAGIILKEPMAESEVRRLAAEAVKAPTVEEIQLQGVPADTRFLIRTEAQDSEDTPPDQTVRAKLAKAFEGALQIVTVAAGSAPTDVPAGGDELRPQFKPFAGGKQVEIEFNPPQSVPFVRRSIGDSIAGMDAKGGDIQARFAVVPAEPMPPDVDVETFERAPHARYVLATKLDIGQVLERVSANLSGAPLFDPYDQFGPQVASETQTRAIFAILLSWFGIIVYIWFRFESWTFGVAGVCALVHDVLVAVGLMAAGSMLAAAVPAAKFFALTEMRIDLNIVAALLTLVGYSINDTIVIFDRVRELRGKSPRITPELVNRALNATLSRTIITATTSFMSVLVLYLFGGAGIHGFAFVLVVGIVSGTYSTLYIACPVMLWLEKWRSSDARQAAPPSVPAATAAP